MIPKTLRTESDNVLEKEKLDRLSPLTGPKVKKHAELAQTVFGKTWALVIFDEAQSLRTEGPLSLAAHALRVRSESMILATATPLFNGEKVSGLERIVLRITNILNT